MKLTVMRANLLLLLTAMLWGSGFVVLKIALDANVPPGFINFIRGLLFMGLTWAFFHKKIRSMTLPEFRIGLFAGLLNFGGFLMQTIGVKYTTPSNNAFISSTYVVIIPFLAWMFYRKSLQAKSLLAIALCVGGMGVLTGIADKGLAVNIGDVYSLICAVFYAGSIVYLGYSARKADVSLVAFMLAAVQTAGGLVFFLIAEQGTLPAVDWSRAILPMLYVAVICSFLGQIFQITAQQHTSATSAGLIMMLEGVFGSLFSIAFGFESFSSGMLTGGSLIVLSLVIMEVDIRHISPAHRKRKAILISRDKTSV
ncbi:MAG: superfamily drug/metabolite transporter [Paenibacillaceae bacterium]|jgi:drug/metabolite transporter (DMT)-like permease|nr:superfamily drug/metabolite transporter [Paenibacillaceae bacterium]